jgi:probable HAF family extracellular repeat protein
MKIPSGGVATILVFLVSIVWGPSLASAQATFELLGDLPGGIVFSQARGISADGLVVVGTSSGSTTNAFRWTAGVMEPLDEPTGTIGIFGANDASADGSVIAGDLSTAVGGAGRWTAAGGWSVLGDLPGGRIGGTASGVSADGSVVVGSGRSESSEPFEAIRWTPGGGIVGLGDLSGGSLNSVALATSGDGSVVVGLGNSDRGFEVFRWTAADGMVGLGFPPGGFRSDPGGISADGKVIVGLTGGQAFRWTAKNPSRLDDPNNMELLGDLVPGTPNSAALDASADGSVVVGRGSGFGLQAFIWDCANGMRNLSQILIAEGLGSEIGTFQLREATAVSDDGEMIAGWGEHTNGDLEAWVARVPQLCPGDSDCDGTADGGDNCCALPNADQANGDSDTIGDACDNCRLIANADPVPAGRLGTGGQLDDDQDGVGNLCDADFTEGNGDGFVNVNDLLAFLDAFGKNITDSTCPDSTGAATGSCARYDLTGEGPIINVTDLLAAISPDLFGKSIAEQGCGTADDGLVHCPLP